MKTSLADLRAHMFDVIERLKATNDPDADQKDKIDLETARAISEAGKIIIDAAKTEVDALKVIANADGDTRWFTDSKNGILALSQGTSEPAK